MNEWLIGELSKHSNGYDFDGWPSTNHTRVEEFHRQSMMWSEPNERPIWNMTLSECLKQKLCAIHNTMVDLKDAPRQSFLGTIVLWIESMPCVIAKSGSDSNLFDFSRKLFKSFRTRASPRHSSMEINASRLNIHKHVARNAIITYSMCLLLLKAFENRKLNSTRFVIEHIASESKDEHESGHDSGISSFNWNYLRKWPVPRVDFICPRICALNINCFISNSMTGFGRVREPLNSVRRWMTLLWAMDF